MKVLWNKGSFTILNKKRVAHKEPPLKKEEEGGIEEENFYDFPTSAVILSRRTSLFYFLIDGRKKDARTPEKPFKRHLKLSLLILTLGGFLPSHGLIYWC